MDSLALTFSMPVTEYKVNNTKTTNNYKRGCISNSYQTNLTYLGSVIMEIMDINVLLNYKRINVRIHFHRPPLWSSGQSFWLHIQRFRVRFPTLQDFLKSMGSGTRFTQPREDN
jgi:archaellum component FlaF (FlaF/FlaG flagellin family)